MKRAIPLLLVLAACGGSFTDKAARTLGTALSATNAARDEFVKWDKQHQLALVDRAQSKDEGKRLLADYRAKRQRVVQAFTVAYSSIAGAAVLVPLVEAGKKSPGELAALLVETVEAVKVAVDVFGDIRDAFEGLHPPTVPPPAPPEPKPEPSPAAAGETS